MVKKNKELEKQDINITSVSIADAIWNQIKDINLNLFALPDQTVAKYCTPIPVEPTKLYLTVKVSSVLTALEDSLGKEFNFDAGGRFIIVTRK